MTDKIIDLFVNFIDLFRFWQVIVEYERGVVLRFGRFHRVLEPGLHWLIPFNIDHVLHDNVVPRTVNLGAQSLMTLDGRTIAVSAVVTARIKDIRKALLEVEGVDHALIDSCSTAVAHYVATNSWEDLRREQRNDELTKECRKQGWRYGLEIDKVQLSDISPCRAIRLHMPHTNAITSAH